MAFKFTALLAAAVVVAGCAGGGTGTERLRERAPAPSFVLTDLISGERINSAKTVQDHHATVIAIWSMACPSCREALIDIQRVYEEYGPQSVAFIGINFDLENIQGVRAFIKGEGIGFPTVWDNRRRAVKGFKALDYTFSVFVVDRQGIVAMAQYDHPPDLRNVLAKTLDDLGERTLE